MKEKYSMPFVKEWFRLAQEILAKGAKEVSVATLAYGE
jgi:hypothetical protein